eukprot:3608749-Pyramimonas_sp.AAC.1
MNVVRPFAQIGAAREWNHFGFWQQLVASANWATSTPAHTAPAEAWERGVSERGRLGNAELTETPARWRRAAGV